MKQIARAPSRSRRASSSAASARAERLVGRRGVPHADPLIGGRRAVVVDQAHVLQAGQALGELDGVGDRGRSQEEARLGAVGPRDSPQAAEHVGDVRAEDSAVDVRLVDDDDGEVREHVGPGGVVGEDADVEHVGVGEHDVGVAAEESARLARGVAVVDRRTDSLAQAEGGERARLILSQGLGRIQVESAGAGIAAEDVERRQVEAHRLAGCGPRRDDRGRLPRGVDGVRLV
jgi:hypothetical protein